MWPMTGNVRLTMLDPELRKSLMPVAAPLKTRSDTRLTRKNTPGNSAKGPRNLRPPNANGCGIISKARINPVLVTPKRVSSRFINTDTRSDACPAGGVPLSVRR